MLYVYAILKSSHQLREDSTFYGLKDHLVEIIRHEAVAAAITRHGERSIPTTPPNVLAHERVVERFMADGPVLPARFGTCFPDDAALLATLALRGAELQALLKRVSGCVELGVRVLRHPKQEPPPAGAVATDQQDVSEAPGSGRCYMLARLHEERLREQRQQEGRKLAEELHGPLSAASRAATCRTQVNDELLLSGAYLVGTHDVEQFRAEVQTLAAQHPDLRVLCTGPWPPYHFVSIAASPEAQRV